MLVARSTHTTTPLAPPNVTVFIDEAQLELLISLYKPPPTIILGAPTPPPLVVDMELEVHTRTTSQKIAHPSISLRWTLPQASSSEANSLVTSFSFLHFLCFGLPELHHGHDPLPRVVYRRQSSITANNPTLRCASRCSLVCARYGRLPCSLGPD